MAELLSMLSCYLKQAVAGFILGGRGMESQRGVL